MIRSLRRIGNSTGLIIPKAVLDLLNITAATPLELTTDGEQLVVTPLRPAEEGK